MTRPRTVCFEATPWDPAGPTLQLPASRITITITLEDVEASTWARFQDPVSTALHRTVSCDTAVMTFWNSDSFAPRYHDDDARITFSAEKRNPATREITCHQASVPLPARAARAMWRLRRDGAGAFRPVTMSINVPAFALPAPEENPAPPGGK